MALGVFPVVGQDCSAENSYQIPNAASASGWPIRAMESTRLARLARRLPSLVGWWCGLLQAVSCEERERRGEERRGRRGEAGQDDRGSMTGGPVPRCHKQLRNSSSESEIQPSRRRGEWQNIRAAATCPPDFLRPLELELELAAPHRLKMRAAILLAAAVGE